jgi:hypothetical protein
MGTGPTCVFSIVAAAPDVLVREKQATTGN